MDNPSVHGPSFPAAVPGLIPPLGTPGNGIPLPGKCPEQENFQLPGSLVAAFTLNFWGGKSAQAED